MLKLGFNSTWTERFQVYKLDEKWKRDQRSNCQHPLDHGKREGVPEKHLLLLHWYTKAFDCVDHSKLWKVLEEMRIPDDLTCLLRNLYASQEATVRARHGTRNWGKIRKGVHQACILSPCLFNFYAEYIMRSTRLMSHKLEGRLPGEIRTTSDVQIISP